MKIDHCVCTQQSFKDLRSRALADGLNFDQLCDATKAGKGCGLCRPYLRRCLMTGETAFHQILVESEPAADPRRATKAG